MVKKLMMKKSKKGLDLKKSKLLKSKISTKKIKDLGISYLDMANILVKATDYLIKEISHEDLDLIQTNFVSLKTVGQLQNNLQRIYGETRRVLSTFINNESLYFTEKQRKIPQIIMGIDMLDPKGNICQRVERFNGKNNNHVYSEVTYITPEISDRANIVTTLSTSTIDKLAEARIRTETRYLIGTSVNPTFELSNNTLKELNSSKMPPSDEITYVKQLDNEVGKPEIIDAINDKFGCAVRYDENSPNKSWYMAATIKKLRDLVTSKSKAVITAAFPVFTGTMLAAVTEFVSTGSVTPASYFNETFSVFNFTSMAANDTMVRLFAIANYTTYQSQSS